MGKSDDYETELERLQIDETLELGPDTHEVRAIEPAAVAGVGKRRSGRIETLAGAIVVLDGDGERAGRLVTVGVTHGVGEDVAGRRRSTRCRGIGDVGVAAVGLSLSVP